MSSQTYLELLGAALSRMVPIQERMNVLRYYKEYFEDAGPEREQEIIRELGDPRALAEKIAREGGWLDGDTPRPVRQEMPRRKVWPVVLAVCVVLVAVAGTVGGAIFGLNVIRQITITSSPVSWTWSGPSYGGAGVVEIVEGDAPIVLQEGFDTVEVDIGIGNVTVCAGESCGVWIDCDTDEYKVGYTLENGRLTVSSAPERAQSDWKDLAEVEVVITIPLNVRLNEADVKVGAGTVELRGISGRKLSVSTGVGSVSAEYLWDVDELSLETGMGDMTLTGELGRETELDTGMGAVTVDASCTESDCEYTLETGMGVVTVNGHARGQKASRSPGDLWELEASTGMGSVEVSFAGGI